MGLIYGTPKRARLVPSTSLSYGSLQRLGAFSKHFKLGFESISGAVYFDLEYEYALKYFRNSKKEKKLFLTEVHAYNKLRELNINFVPKIYETNSCNGGSYILMEYCGRDLCNIGKLMFQSWARIAEFLFDSLTRLHEHGINHGDIKSENITMSSTNELKLIDLGFTSRGMSSRGYGTIPFITPYNRDPFQNDKYAAALTLIELAGYPHTDVDICCIFSEEICNNCRNTQVPLKYARIEIQKLYNIEEPKLLVDLVDIVLTQVDTTKEYLIWNRATLKFKYGNKLFESQNRRVNNINEAWDNFKKSLDLKSDNV